MRIAVTGSSGLIGGKLVALAEGRGHEVIRLVRRPPQSAAEREWRPGQSQLDSSALADVDAVIHLAGENIAGRWTKEKKRRIHDSRVLGTRLLAEAIAGMDRPPQALICASAVGYYGDRGDEVLVESSPPGDGFLAEVCRDWESAADPCRDSTRVAHCRLGMVLSSQGGALSQMLTPFKMGAGGVIGSGRQFWSWIVIDDAAGVFLQAAEHEEVHGPVNAASPQPATCREFVKTLGHVLHRPTLLPMPAAAARAVFGEMADALILCSARVRPAVLEEQGFAFRHPDLEPALRAALDR